MWCWSKRLLTTAMTPKGRHPSGKAEVLADGRLRITILDTAAGRHAIAMLRDDLLDAVLVNGTVRLRVYDEPLPGNG